MFTASILPQFIDGCEIQVLRSPPLRIDPRLLPDFLLVFFVRTHLYLLSDANSEKLFRKNSHLFTISKESVFRLPYYRIHKIVQSWDSTFKDLKKNYMYMKI